MVGRHVYEHSEIETGELESRKKGRRFEDFQRHGGSAVHDLASAIYVSLPREVRDYIYTYCLEPSYDNQIIIRRSRNAPTAFTYLIRKSYGPHAYRWVADPICALVSAQNLSEEVAREILETYYWTRTFSFSHRELLSITPFLTTDHFGLGVVPASYVRRLHVQIQPGMLMHICASRPKKSEQESCLQAINALGTILARRTEVTIDIEAVECGQEREDQVSSIRLDSTSVIQKLKRRGFGIELRSGGG